jgi:recombinational DNA repair protein (RecF pathway)
MAPIVYFMQTPHGDFMGLTKAIRTNKKLIGRIMILEFVNRLMFLKRHSLSETASASVLR